VSHDGEAGGGGGDRPEIRGEVTVGIDIGSTSVKAVAVDAEGTIVDRVRLPHQLIVPAPDRLEHDADQAWRQAPQQALHRLMSTGAGTRADAAPPAAVAVSSMVPSLTAVDGQGRPIGPGLLYGDARGGGRAREPGEVGDGREMVGFLRWLAAEVPEAAGYWPAPAVANHALGGVSTVDITTAFASMPLFGPEGWDEAICRECGTSADTLPEEVAMMGAPIGTVAGTDATLAGGAIDAVCEQLVSGADEVGDVLVLCGTTLITWIVTAEAVDVPGLWAIPHTTPDRWLVGGPSNAGGLFLGWASRLLARPPGGGPAAGERLDPARIPVWEPYIRGERTPLHDPDRRAAVHDLDLTHGPAALRRAAWEASGFVVRHHIDLATDVAGVPARRIVAVGGATRIDGAMQALADATGLDVHVAAVPEGAALGAAYLARMARTGETDMAGAAAWARTGRIVEPDPAWTGPTAARYQRFRSLA
jgi:xylulokinase